MDSVEVGPFEAHYWQYHSERWLDFDSAERAVAFLRDGEDYGELSAVGVVFPDGTERAYDYVEDKLSDVALPAVRGGETFYITRPTDVS